METKDQKVRLDKWLWVARFFKTRALAAEAINGGKIHINGQRAKAAHPMRIGDELCVRKGPQEFVIVVTGVDARRGSAQHAAKLYEETPESRATRELLAEQLRLAALATPRADKRPNKKQRRQILRFTGKG